MPAITHGETAEAYTLDEVRPGWTVAVLRAGAELPAGPGITFGVDVLFLSTDGTSITYRLLDDDGSMVTYIRPKTVPLADLARIHIY